MIRRRCVITRFVVWNAAIRHGWSLPQEIDVQLEPSTLDERSGEDVAALPVDDRAPRRKLGRTAAVDQLVESPEEGHGSWVLPVEIGLDTVEIGHVRRAFP
jgi:hypothetical protein